VGPAALEASAPGNATCHVPAPASNRVPKWIYKREKERDILDTPYHHLINYDDGVDDDILVRSVGGWLTET
jgi:hypothetical protein